MYHPAAALHQPSLKSTVEKDFARLPELIARAAQIPEYQEPASEDHDEGQQLSLF
jgi:DNA polymerase